MAKITYYYRDSDGMVVPPRDIFIKRGDIRAIELEDVLVGKDNKPDFVTFIKDNKPVTAKGKELHGRGSSAPKKKKAPKARTTKPSGGVAVSDAEPSVEDILNGIEG